MINTKKQFNQEAFAKWIEAEFCIKSRIANNIVLDIINYIHRYDNIERDLFLEYLSKEISRYNKELLENPQELDVIKIYNELILTNPTKKHIEIEEHSKHGYMLKIAKEMTPEKYHTLTRSLINGDDYGLYKTYDHTPQELELKEYMINELLDEGDLINFPSSWENGFTKESYYRSVEQLTDNELEELRESYYWEKNEKDLDRNEITKEILFNEYEGIVFVENDFFCNQPEYYHQENLKES